MCMRCVNPRVSVVVGSSTRGAALKELHEELGITAQPEKLQFLFTAPASGVYMNGTWCPPPIATAGEEGDSWGGCGLQIFWFYQIVRIGILSLRNGTQSMDDIREKARNSPPATAALKHHHQQQDQQVLPPQKEPLSPALATTSKRAAARGKAKAAS